jgi:PilZ domain-containing protein
MERERRQSTRIRPTQLVYVELGADNGGMVRDISETGIGFCAVRAVAELEEITFVFRLEGERRLEGNAELAWMDVAGKVGGLRFLKVSDEFRGQLYSWLRRNSVPAGSVTHHVPTAATPMERIEQPAREPVRQLLKPVTEGQSKALRVDAMRIATDAAAPAKKKEPSPRRPLNAPVLSYAGSEIISPEVKPRLSKPAVVEQARESARHGIANVLHAAVAMLVVMLLMILFLSRQEAGDGLIWLGKKIAGEPRVLPIQQSDEQVQTPSPIPDTSTVGTPKEQENGGMKETVLAPLSTTVPGHIAAPARTSPPVATGEFPSSALAAAKNGNSEAGSHPEAIQPKVVTEDKAEVVQLLWADVARGEISAEVALADMYVRGDGVPKNCAQARVLLSAAAKKGNVIAVRKLIDLDSEGGGCGNSSPQ